MNNSLKTYYNQPSLRDAVAEKYIAHYRGDFKNCLFLDTNNFKYNKLIYPAANTIALSSLSASFYNEKIQSFLNTLPGAKGIVCMAQSQNKKYLAWCEETDTVPVIYIVDLFNNLKRKVHANNDIKGNKYISLAFNGTEQGDPKYLAALTNGPEYQVLLLHIEKLKSSLHSLEKNEKIEKQGNITLYRFSEIFYYREEDTLVAMGKGNLKFFKLSPDKIQLKDSPFARREINEKDFNFTAYCVMKDGMIIGTDNGELLYFAANGYFKAILSSSPGENNSIETLIYLSNTTRGFIVGGSDGLLSLYEKTDSKDAKGLYARTYRKLSLNENKGRVSSLALTPKYDELFVGLSTGVILKLSLDKNYGQSCQHALQSFHTDTITGLDVSFRKSLVATCSSDRTVRIWNYLYKNTQEVLKNFEEKPLSLSFHPSGLHLIVSFADKVRMINILYNELVTYKDLSIKNCYYVKFSHGGHLFAVVNNVMVQVFNFYTLDQPPHYQFKAQTGKFQTMVWEDDDLGLYLGTSDGFVFYYKLDDPAFRMQVLSVPAFSVRTLCTLFVAKDEKLGTINYRILYIGGSFSAAISNYNKCIYYVKITPRSDNKYREPQKEYNLQKYNVSSPVKIYTNCNVSRICLLNSHRVFLYTTDEKNQPGTIRYCRYPLNQSKYIYEVQAHSNRVMHLSVTFDDNFLFTAGYYGQFICYEFRENNYKSKLEMPDMSEEFLYSKQKLAAQKRKQYSLKLSNAAEKYAKERNNKEAKEINDRLINELNFKISERERGEKMRYDREVEYISKMEKDQTKKLLRLYTYHKEKRYTVYRDYADKIQLEQTRFTELGKMKESYSKKFNDIVQTIKNNHQKKKQSKEQEFEEELRLEKEELKKFEEIYEMKSKEYEIEQYHFENEAEKEIKINKEYNEVSLKALDYQKNKAENYKLAKKKIYYKQYRSLYEEKHRLKHTLEDIYKIKQKHEENVQKKQSQTKEIEERYKTIRDKVTRINELKKKTQELEKFKFVLDYKIKYLKRDIGPREEYIAKMREQIANMNNEIIHFKSTNDNMNLIVKDLVSKHHGMYKEIDELTTIYNSNLGYIKSFEYDVSDMHQNCLQNYKALKGKVIEVFRKYVQEDNLKQTDGIDQQKYFIKERAHLYSTVKGLKEKFKKSIDLHYADNKRIMSQNEELISEINDLKREKKNLKDDYFKKELQKYMSAKLQQEREDTLQLYEKLVKECNHLLENDHKKKKRDQQVETA